MIPVNRTYQITCVDGVCEAARNGKKVIIMQGATGCGKTNMICDLNRRAINKGTPVLNIAHRRRLVDQMSERFFEFQIDHGIIMAERHHEKDTKIKVASRDTMLARCINREYMDMPEAKLVIIDEGRHAASPEMRNLLAYYEQRGAYIVLTDATPVLSDGRGLGPWAQAIVCAAKVTDLVKDGFLVPVKCFAPDRELHRGKAKRGIAGDLVESWQQYAQDMPTILFTSRVQHSLDAMLAFNMAGISAKHVDANTSDCDRDAAFDGLADGSVKVVCNVGIVKEGVDIPCLGCCQIYMDVPGRVNFLQMCGRIMRPYAGKDHGILIDHAGAVFRHGFPDEDTEWTLTGNVDADFAIKKKSGLTETVHYCKNCERIYHGEPGCPQCGKMPVKSPRSIFAPPPMETRNELLVEAGRNGSSDVYANEEKIKHWMRCLSVAKNKNGNFKMASVIYKQKYGEWPADNFPCLPPWNERDRRILEVYPNFGNRKKGG